MTGYDPRSSRPRPPVAPLEEVAPIEALLGPAPERPGGEVAELAPRGAAPQRSCRHKRLMSGAPSQLAQLAPVLLIAGALVALAAWLRRRGRS